MISSKMFRMAGAAILGTLVGTSPAYAAYLDDNGVVQDQSLFALETLSGASSHSKLIDGVRHYHAPHNAVAGTGSEFEFKLPVGVTGSGNSIRLRFEFSGGLRIGQNPLAPASLTFQQTQGGTAVANVAASNVNVFLGGMPEDDYVEFVVTMGATTGTLTTSNYVTLTLVNFYVAADGDGATGSIQLASAYKRVSGIDSAPERGETVPGILVLKALDHDIDPTPATASVDHEYMRFVGGTTGLLMTSIGSIELSVQDTPGTPAAVLVGGFNGATTVPLLIGSASKVTFSGGNLGSFVSNVYSSADPACSSGASLVDITGAGDTRTVEWKSGGDRLDATMFATKQYICILVDGRTPIPLAAPIVATLEYTGVNGEDTAFPPSHRMALLGGIDRGGVMTHIAYLTTSDFYDQRLVLRNRGSSRVPYTLEFVTETGVTADPPMVTGNLDSGVTVLKVRDLVTIEGPPRRAAAILSVTAPDNDIGVATTQITRGASRTTDTVVYRQ